MEATARRVRAERNRRRLPPRGAVSRWTRRITGLLATVAVLGVGVASYKMIAPDHSASKSAALAPGVAHAARPVRARHHAHKPAGLTKAQKAARAAAVAELRTQGYAPLKKSDYDPRATLRVLIGRPLGNASGGAFAFFFNRGRYLGRDSLSPSAALRVVGQSSHAVVLSYRTCCPAAHVHVRFKLAGGAIQPSQPVPPWYLRAAHR
jgi:hypothetical protein